MRILHLIYDHINNPWVGGGGAVRVYEIYRRLTLRHQVTVVCGKYPGAGDYGEGNLAFNFVGLSKNNYIFSTFFYAIKAALFLSKKKDSFDVVVEDFAPYNPVFSFIWRKNAIIQLHQKEGWHIVEKYFIFGLLFVFIEEVYHKVFKHTIILSEIGKRRFRLSHDAVVIPNGFNAELLQAQGIEGDYILFLGRIHIDSKGLDILCAALKYTNQKIKLIIAGTGRDSQKVSKLFEDYIKNDMVEMIGFVGGEEKIRLLKDSKFMIMPSRYEGQPLALLEAAACGRPVVVSNIPEFKPAVESGFAMAFKKGDPKDLAAKIEILLRDSSLRRDMGIRARAYAKNYTWDKIAEEYEKSLIKFIAK